MEFEKYDAIRRREKRISHFVVRSEIFVLNNESLSPPEYLIELGVYVSENPDWSTHTLIKNYSL